MEKNALPPIGYHHRTKHSPQRYAAGPGYMDWATQPDPFRSYEGAERTGLSFYGDELAVPYAALYSALPPFPMNADAVGALFQLALGLAAWKQYGGERWALRCNPSSGNLHPTEGYLITGALPGIAPGVHHYHSYHHALERRCAFDAAALPPKVFLIGLSSIFWREAWKYGERAYRYCNHDAGHAIAAFRYAAAALGWKARLLAEAGDALIARLLGIGRDEDYGGAEREHPDCLLLISADDAAYDVEQLEKLADAAAGETWRGTANRLSEKHQHDWPVIESAAKATLKPLTKEPHFAPPPLPAPAASSCEETAALAIRGRRSAQAFDGETPLPAASFYRMLDMLLPRPGIAPWDALPWEPLIHPLIFVHRVAGLAPGLYALPRSAHGEAVLRQELDTRLAWERAPGGPGHLPLYMLAEADLRDAAQAVCCSQEIAADGAFSMGMLGLLDEALGRGAWWYRRLFWEAGVLGQALYLEAEAAGVRGTGIGCYLDDLFHQMAGIEGSALQSMYHFTVGTPLTDARLATLPPYGHLGGRK